MDIGLEQPTACAACDNQNSAARIVLRDRSDAIASRPFFKTPDPFIMSQHRSLKGAATIAAKRNVLKRFERVEVLKRRGQWKSGDKVLGLRKTKPDA
jgi:small basic protein (TIGR04137 family)